jgi:hypothetical protein
MAIAPMVGTAVGNGLTGARTPQAQALQDAMTRAVEQAQAEGVTDPEEIKRRKADVAARFRG